MGYSFGTERTWDVVLVGGGLANGLLAYRLSQTRPDLSVLVIEQGKAIGGHHTWSFHSSDLSSEEFLWIKPLISRSWESYAVEFPLFSRTLSGGYHSIRSEKFHEVVYSVIEKGTLLGRKVAAVESTSVRLEDGQVIQSHCVLDGRGFSEAIPGRVGYQKFLGLDVTLTQPHGRANPLLMDVNCEQEDGFRFFYLLPWTKNSFLIEDTHYSDTPEVDVSKYRDEILSYVTRKGWEVQSVDREEVAALPIPLFEEFTDPNSVPTLSPGVVSLGVRSGFFHPTTGYSFCHAVRVADALSRLPEISSAAVETCLQNYSESIEVNLRFFRFLNRMLFWAAVPNQRYKVLQRFYRLSDGLIHRFYSGNLKFSDYVRILSGRPPVPIQHALKCLFEKRGRIQIENRRHDV